MAVFEDVRDVVVEQLSVDPQAVKLESKIIEDLGADSLDVVELVMAYSEAEKLVSIQDVVNYIEKLGK